jgi:hypothetical protein
MIGKNRLISPLVFEELSAVFLDGESAFAVILLRLCYALHSLSEDDRASHLPI